MVISDGGGDRFNAHLNRAIKNPYVFGGSRLAPGSELLDMLDGGGCTLPHPSDPFRVVNSGIQIVLSVSDASQRLLGQKIPQTQDSKDRK